MFRRLLAAYTLNELAWTAGVLALSVLVYRRTGSAIGAMAFFLCAEFIPALLTPPLAARIDRSPPRIVLPLLYGLEAMLFGLLGWMAHSFPIGLVLALVVADGAVALVARALASTARVGVLKPLDLLHEGNAIVNGVFSLCFFAGPAIGGAIVALGGTKAALFVNCGLFAVMAMVLATTDLPRRALATGPQSGRLRAALAYARADRRLRVRLSLFAVAQVVFSITTPVTIVFVSHSLHDGAAAYGVLLSAWGAGAVAGSVVFARWRRGRLATLISYGAAATGVGFALWAVAPSLAFAIVGVVIGGTGNGTVAIALQTAIQEQTTDEWMGVIMSLTEAIGSVAPGAGILIGGVITAVFSPRIALAVAAGAAMAFALSVSVNLRSDPTSSRRRAPEPLGAEVGDGPGPAVAHRESLV